MLSVCIIVKNNEEIISKCLQSVKELADEIVVVDTGSTDKTKEIAEKFGRVYDFEWKDDFSAAKNYAISKASNEWILEIDADEIISECDHSKIKEITEKGKHVGYYLVQRNYTNERGGFGWTSCTDDSYEESKVASGFVPRKMARLFKNDSRIRNEGKIHDSVVKSIEKIGNLGHTEIPIHHFGSLNQTKERLRWYIDIEKKNLRNDFFQEYQIAIQLHKLGELGEALEHLMKSLKLNENFYLSWLETAIIIMKKGKISEVRPLLMRSLELKDYGMTWSQLGIVEAYEGNHEKAIECFERAVASNDKNADFHFNLAQALKHVGRKERARKEFEKAAYLNPYYKDKN
jgi:glycosyltransferase involved in cell wall biosynthesis